MSYASLDQFYNGNLTGNFRHAETDNPFDFINLSKCECFAFIYKGKIKWAKHKIFVGPTGDETRFALVLKTVAYVIVDDTADGWIVEKWKIKNCKSFKED